MTKVSFYGSGQTTAFGDDGEQIPGLQEPWVLLYVKHLLSQNVDPTTVRFRMPNGQYAKILRGTFEGEVSYNWELL